MDWRDGHAHNGEVEIHGAKQIRDGSSVILLDSAHHDLAVSAQWFSAEFWAERDALKGTATGRGSVAFVEHGASQWALRHYRRGGLVGRVNADRYLFTGHERVRAVRELKLLRQLCDWNLPTAAPVASRYQRSGLWYRADLLTEVVSHRETLAEYLMSRVPTPQELKELLSEVHAVVGQFHARGVYHADLNCHNVLLRDEGVAIIDFDRGEIRRPGAWQHANFDRLQRSALKVSRQQHHETIMAACRECFGVSP